MCVMSSKHPCLEPPPHLKRVERPEQIVREPLTLKRLLRLLPRLR
jgi:hypothetical protein